MDKYVLITFCWKRNIELYMFDHGLIFFTVVHCSSAGIRGKVSAPRPSHLRYTLAVYYLILHCSSISWRSGAAFQLSFRICMTYKVSYFQYLSNLLFIYAGRCSHCNSCFLKFQDLSATSFEAQPRVLTVSSIRDNLIITSESSLWSEKPTQAGGTEI